MGRITLSNLQNKVEWERTTVLAGREDTPEAATGLVSEDSLLPSSSAVLPF